MSVRSLSRPSWTIRPLVTPGPVLVAPADPPAPQYPWTAVLVGDRPVWFGSALPTSPDWVAPFLWFNTTTETLSAVLADAVTGYSDIYSDVYA